MSWHQHQVVEDSTEIYRPGIVHSITTTSDNTVKTEHGFEYHQLAFTSASKPLFVDFHRRPSLQYIGGHFYEDLCRLHQTKFSAPVTTGNVSFQEQHKRPLHTAFYKLQSFTHVSKPTGTTKLFGPELTPRHCSGELLPWPLYKPRTVSNEEPLAFADTINGRGHSVEPGLYSDTPPIDGRSAELQKLAIEVFQFWPEGAVYHKSSTLCSASSSGSAGQTKSSASSCGVQGRGDSENKAQKATRTGRSQSSGKDVQLARGCRQNATAGHIVLEWRCLWEAGRNDLACDASHFTRFDSMLRHLQSHAEDLDGIPFATHIAHMKTYLKLSSIEGREIFSASLFIKLYPGKDVPYLRFDRRPDNSRDPYPPPMIQLLPPTTSAPVPELPAVTEDPICQVASPFAAASVAQDVPQSFSTSAVKNFATAMKHDPILALQVEQICQRVRAAKRMADAKLEALNRQTASKRKELDEDPEFQSSTSQPLKRQRGSEIDYEHQNEMNEIDTEIRQQLGHAIREMEKLHRRHFPDQSSAQSTTQNISQDTPQTSSLDTPSPELLTAAFSASK